jgi:hypothetical protein
METLTEKLQREIDDAMLEHDQQNDLRNDCLKRDYELGAQIHHDNMTVCGKRVMAARKKIGEILKKTGKNEPST